MCGIAGVAGISNRIEAIRAVRRMTSSLARRGPDGEGTACWDDAVLGHRRLAIIDLSAAGHQPMVSADRSVGVVSNGEIYNYRELRSELYTRGCRFGSNSDTEVLIHGYREWGLDHLVSRLRGMFALGLWDDQRRMLFLVRDRLGVKPLVFAVRGRTIAFASTVRALRLAGFVREINESAVMDFLELGYVTDSHTIYHGAFKVPAATIVEWSNGALSRREYWVPPPVSPPPTLSFQEAVERTEQLFLDAVKVRLHADVPVSMLLSGGIDSALVCWAVTTHGQDLTAYTIGLPGDPWDETAAARATARDIGIEHCVLDMSVGDTPEAEELVSVYAEPFACASALGMLRVSKAIAPSVKVLLTGDGGDDVFLGYPRHRDLWIAGKLADALPTAITRRWLTARSRLPRKGLLRHAAVLLDYASGDLKALTGKPSGFAIYKKSGLLGSRLRDLYPDHREILSPRHGNNRMLTSFLNFERKVKFVGQYLTKVDGATMHYALEARSPFLDQYLWEFAAALPFDFRIRRGRLKAILRELVRRRISESVARRRKRGFDIPVQRWLVGRWRPLVETVWRESLLDKEGWICAKSVLAQLALAANTGWAPKQLWYLFVFELWMRYEHRNLPDHGEI